ncbi:hypothetical protein [Enterobacter hormaechei]|uniref:hypothetical protein n=1 Tax=Enterobacter hormaechei TaxID=158836 RepID=UPI000CD1EBD1|nr:hypothetical protein [Enterobacter hormaechei]PNY63741.1 hypothetical protein C2M14_04720 [Enterobacter cloacae]HAV1825797.1 hypothetical protein [Enterobacter hormaechei subsp. steigerwaltii]MBG0648864.1 hypothetical protein [Enterobacter hormaechei]MCM7068844.1 hypothetical protein [Enterobacter hormaechei]MCO7993132.1 hypothetical protein [Enterobacter hormaechei]
MHLLKKIILSVIFIHLSGCTAFLWEENRVTETKLDGKTLISDEVTAAFYYENLSASAIQGKTQVKVGIPQNGVAFQGEKNIYILTKGAKELLALDKLSTQVALVSGFEKFDGLRLKLDVPHENDVVMHFSDTLVLQVNESYSKLTAQEVDALKNTGFWNEGGRYVKQLRLEGVIIPRDRNESLFNTSERLVKKHNVEFYSIEDSTRFHPLRLATNIVLTPFTAVADIVFFPISLRVLGLITNPPVH